MGNGRHLVSPDWRSQRDRQRLRWTARFLLWFVAASAGCTASLIVLAALAAFGSGVRLADVGALEGVTAGLVWGASALAIVGIARSRSGVGWPRDIAKRSLPVPSHVRSRVDTLALAVGVQHPQVVVLDSTAVNATVSGRGDTARVILTSGACELDGAEVEAIVAYSMAVISDTELSEAHSAVVAVSCYAALAKFLVGLLALSLVLGAFGRHHLWASVAVASTLALVVVGIFGAAATAAAIEMSGAAGRLADSRAIEITLQAEAYATLLVRMAEEPELTRSSLSPLVWLEHTTTRDDMVSVFGMLRAQRQIERRARRMCTVAGVYPPATWAE